MRVLGFVRGLAPQPRLIWAVAIGAGLIALAVVSPVLGLVAIVYHTGLVIIAARDLALVPGRSGYTLRRSTPEPFSLGEPEEVTVTIQNRAAAGLLAKMADHAPAGLRPARPPGGHRGRGGARAAGDDRARLRAPHDRAGWRPGQARPRRQRRADAGLGRAGVRRPRRHDDVR